MPPTPTLAAPIQEELEKKRAEVAEKHAAAVKARQDVLDSGVDPMSNEDAFDAIGEAFKAWKMVAEEEASLERQWKQALELDGLVDTGSAGAGEFKGSTPAPAQSITGLTAADLFKALGGAGGPADPFAQIVEGQAYKSLVDSGALGRKDSPLGTVFLGEAIDRKALKAMIRTLGAKTLVTGGSATSGGAFVVNDHIPGLYVDLPRKEPVAAGLVLTGQTDSDTVEYVEMTARTNAAAETAEGSDAPESAITTAVRTANVKEIPHFIPATKRALADAGQLQTLLEGELVDGVIDRLDTQVVNGDGTGENLTGILNTSGIGTGTKTALEGAGTPGLEAVLSALTTIWIAFYQADAVVFHPTDWQQVRVARADGATGEYLMGPPSQAGDMTVWGIPAVVSQVVPQGTVLAGAFRRGATLWLREGVSVSASDSHSDYFIKRQVAILASMRAAFAAQRAAAFYSVTGFGA